jgi:phosphoribosylcarboxyaminoimidazole (NCAIR) mutase
MPKGIPVATVAIDGSANAALLAIEMLAIKDDNLRQLLAQYREKMAQEVKAKNEKLNTIGLVQYLKEKGAK